VVTCRLAQISFDVFGKLTSPLQGTKEFMSEWMLSNLDNGFPYQQSVIDDVASFLNVAFWAALFNTVHAGDKTAAERPWRRDVRSGYKEREYAHTKIVSGHQVQLSGFLRAFRPLLGDWRNYIQGLSGTSPRPLEGRLEILRWDLEQQIFAVQSVLAFANILLRHHDDLKAA